MEKGIELLYLGRLKRTIKLDVIGIQVVRNIPEPLDDLTQGDQIQ